MPIALLVTFHYQGELPGVHQDLIMMKAYLQGRYDIITYGDEDFTSRDEFLNWLNQVFGRRALLYISAHGINHDDGRSSLLLPNRETINFQLITDILSLSMEALWINDCCYTQAGIAWKLERENYERVGEVDIDGNILLLCSSQHNQAAWTSPEGSSFTKLLVGQLAQEERYIPNIICGIQCNSYHDWYPAVYSTSKRLYIYDWV